MVSLLLSSGLVDFSSFVECFCEADQFTEMGCVEIVNQDGKSSLLSLVKAFDTVLAVYEGFCNLKQVLFSSHFSPVFTLFYVSLQT